MKENCFFLIVFLGLFWSCTSQNVPQLYAGKPLVIIDTDMGSSTDDLFALQMLHYYEQQGMCRILGVMIDREGGNNAACADVMNTYFGNAAIPLGLVRNGIKNPKVWIDYQRMPFYTLSDGAPMFRRSVSDYSSLPDGWQLYRRLLAQQPDRSVVICSIGFVTCLSQLLQSEPDEFSALNGVELVRRKVACIYMQGGVFGDAEEPDFNLAQGMSFAHVFFNLWPKDVDIVFSPMEAGQDVEYTPEQVIADISWTDTHPVKQVYMTCDCNTGQRMWDVMTIVQAVEGDSRFTLSERGNVTLTPECATIFTPSAHGNCRYQKQGTAEWAQHILQKIRNANISLKAR